MPEPELEPLDVTLSDDDTSVLDEALSTGLSAGPEEFFRLGQAVPEAKNLAEGISAILVAPSPQELETTAAAFSDTLPRPYQGSIVSSPEDLDSIRAEQIAVQPTHINLPTYRGDPRELPVFRWLSTDAFMQHPNRSQFRDITGHEQPCPPRVIPYQAFLSLAVHLKRLDWTETVIFADAPYEVAAPPEQVLKPLSPELWIRFTVAYVKMPFEDGREVPSWVTEEIERYIEANRNQGMERSV